LLVDRARAAIDPLPKSEAKAVLNAMADFVISRPM